MIELTQQQICTDLARAMGWTTRPTKGLTEIWYAPDGVHEAKPFTSAEDSRALIEWLAAQGRERTRLFIDSLWEAIQSTNDLIYEMAFLTAPLPVIALAAHRALGLEVK